MLAGAGRAAAFARARVFCAFVARQRADHHIDAAPDEFRFEVGMAVGRQFGEKFTDDLESEFRVRHFASAEFQRDFHLHVLAQKINRMADLDAEVVRVNARAELNFLDGRGVLMLFRFLVLLGLFVTELAEVHDPAHRRSRRWGKFPPGPRPVAAPARALR